MTEITAAMVKELRDATSAGMMDCKRALQETDGDFDAAVKLLREKGMASAAKRADRETTEGKVGVIVQGDTGAIVAVGCETEPVSNERGLPRVRGEGAEAVFTSAGKTPSRTSRPSGSSWPRSSARTSRSSARSGSRRATASTLSYYVHAPANKVGALVPTRGGDPQVARSLALHLTFARPTYATRDEVPQELVDAEREILSKLRRGASRSRRTFARRSSRACSTSGSTASRCSASRRGTARTSRRRPSASS